MTDPAARIRFTIPGRPVPAARITRTRAKLNLSRQAQRYLAYKQEVAWVARKVVGPDGFLEGPVKILIHIYIAGGRAGDWDNYGKAICDALNGIAYKDDRQVMDGQVIKHRVRLAKDQRAEVEVWEIEEAGGEEVAAANEEGEE